MTEVERIKEPKPQLTTAHLDQVRSLALAMAKQDVTVAEPGKQIGGSIPVSQSCSMSILANGVVTQEGLEKLVKYIDLIKGSFPINEADAKEG